MYKLLVMNKFTGLRSGGINLVLLNRLESVCLSELCNSLACSLQFYMLSGIAITLCADQIGVAHHLPPLVWQRCHNLVTFSPFFITSSCSIQHAILTTSNSVHPWLFVLQDSCLWAGLLTYLIKSALTAFVIAAVLRPFYAKHCRAVTTERRRPTGLGSSINHMLLLDKWDNFRSRQLRTKSMIKVTKRTADDSLPWWPPA